MTIKAIGTRKDYVDADLEFIPIMTAGTKRLDKLPETKEGHHVICQQENFFNDEKTMHLCETLQDMQTLLDKYHAGFLKYLTWYSISSAVLNNNLKDSNVVTKPESPKLSAMHFIAKATAQEQAQSIGPDGRTAAEREEYFRDHQERYYDSNSPYNPFF
jgi:hypothetical protein